MTLDRDAIRTELDRLKIDGVIRPVDVVEAARDKASALHRCFTWNDGEAAHQFRLAEARALLRIYVVTEESETNNVRAFVSLSTDRSKEGGGYRALSDVMSDDEMRQQLLRDAFVQFRNMQQRYRHLQQLAGVWREVDAAEAATNNQSNSQPVAKKRSPKEAKAA